METIIIRKGSWNKRKFEVIFPGIKKVQRFSRISEAKNFAEVCKKENQIIQVEAFEKTKRPIKNNRWQ